MGRRRGGGGGGFGFGRSRAPARTSAAPAPAKQQSSSPGLVSSVGSMIGQGMSFGMGSAIGHRVVGGIADTMSGGGGQEVDQQQQQQYPPVNGAQQQQQQAVCGLEKGNYFDCLKSTQGDQQACQFGAIVQQQSQQEGEKQWS